MTAPDDSQQLDIADVAAEMNADPLSKALFELAQCKVLLRKQSALIQLQKERINELEGRERDAAAQRANNVPPKFPREEPEGPTKK